MALINTTTTGVLGTTVFGDGAGALTVQENGVTINKITKNPTFHAWQQTQQTSIGVATGTKVNLQAVDIDTDSCFSVANSRFTPTIAGYYFITGAAQMPVTATTATLNASIYKNGSETLNGSSGLGSSVLYAVSVVSGIIYLNGTTDYIEMYVYGSNNGSAYSLVASRSRTYLQGFLVKAA